MCALVSILLSFALCGLSCPHFAAGAKSVSLSGGRRGSIRRTGINGGRAALGHQDSWGREEGSARGADRGERREPGKQRGKHTWTNQQNEFHESIRHLFLLLTVSSWFRFYKSHQIIKITSFRSFILPWVSLFPQSADGPKQVESHPRRRRRDATATHEKKEITTW